MSVRKAFLDLDQDFDGYINPEDFSRAFGGSQGSQKVDFSLIKMLLNLKGKKKPGKVNYFEFCDWLGQAIEPTEDFYFRHDSIKNPQYERNMQKSVL